MRDTHGVDGRVKMGPLERRDFPTAFVARFQTKFQKTDGCWLWTAGKFNRGYGMVNLGRFAGGRQHTSYAHRVAYVLAHGAIPHGRVVMHSCDVPACVNPAHLSLGSQADNLQDASRKGRLGGPSLSLRKLSDSDVRHVRLSSERGVVLAERYGVSTTLISMVRRGLRRAV